MAIPSKIFLGDFEEGKGYTPDYWLLALMFGSSKMA